MRGQGSRGGCLGLALAGIMVAGVVQARAQEPAGPDKGCLETRSVPQLLTGAVSDIGKVPTLASAGILAMGGAAALGVHGVDGRVNRTFSTRDDLRDSFRAGAIVGGMPLQFGAAFTTWALGKSLDRPCVAAVGG